MDKLKLITNRLKEPSTWAGLSVIATLLGAPPGALDAVGQVVGGLAALLAIAVPEKAK